MYILTFTKNGKEHTEQFNHLADFNRAKQNVLASGYVIVGEQRN